MSTSSKTCTYEACKDEPETWHGDDPSHWYLEDDSWKCPHDLIDKQKLDSENHEPEYCVFHTNPDELSDDVDEAEEFVRIVNQTSSDADDEDVEVARSEKEFVGATFGAFDVKGAFGQDEEKTLDAGDDFPIRFDHAIFMENMSMTGVDVYHDVSSLGTKFNSSDDYCADFRYTTFTGVDVDFWQAKFTGNGNVNFFGAEFTGGSDVNFGSTEFTSNVSFESAQFTGGSNVEFGYAKFTGNGEVNFGSAEFTGDGEVNFYDTKFTGGGDVSFRGAEFTGDGGVTFWRAEFTGGGDVSFRGAEFTGGGEVVFSGVEFTGSGDVSFRGAEFTGGGKIAFRGAEFVGADFSDARLINLDLRNAIFNIASCDGIHLEDVTMNNQTSIGLTKPEKHRSWTLNAEPHNENAARHESSARGAHALREATVANGLIGKARDLRFRERGEWRKEAGSNFLASICEHRFDLGNLKKWLFSWVAVFVTGYGVRVEWILVPVVLILSGSAAGYWLLNLTEAQTWPGAFMMSLQTFVVGGGSQPNISSLSLRARLLILLESFLGLLFTIILGYVLGTRESP